MLEYLSEEVVWNTGIEAVEQGKKKKEKKVDGGSGGGYGRGQLSKEGRVIGRHYDRVWFYSGLAS